MHCFWCWYVQPILSQYSYSLMSSSPIAMNVIGIGSGFAHLISSQILIGKREQVLATCHGPGISIFRGFFQVQNICIYPRHTKINKYKFVSYINGILLENFGDFCFIVKYFLEPCLYHPLSWQVFVNCLLFDIYYRDLTEIWWLLKIGFHICNVCVRAGASYIRYQSVG